MMTDPFIEMGPPRKMSDSELARAIRQDIAAELDATNLYQAHIDHTDNEEAKRVLAHIRDAETAPAQEFLALLAKLDPVTAQHLAIEFGLPSAPPSLTVGSLIEEEKKAPSEIPEAEG